MWCFVVLEKYARRLDRYGTVCHTTAKAPIQTIGDRARVLAQERDPRRVTFLTKEMSPINGSDLFEGQRFSDISTNMDRHRHSRYLHEHEVDVGGAIDGDE